MSIAETLAGIETPDMPEAAAMRYRVMVLETRRLAAAAQALAAENRALRAALQSIVNNSQPLLDYSGPGWHPISRGTFEVEGSDMDEARVALSGSAAP